MPTDSDASKRKYSLWRLPADICFVAALATKLALLGWWAVLERVGKATYWTWTLRETIYTVCLAAVALLINLIALGYAPLWVIAPVFYMGGLVLGVADGVDGYDEPPK